MNLIRLHIILFCLSMLFSIVGVGQQEAMYSNYRFNALVVNPAYAGTKYSMSALLLTRNQWTGIEGAPETHNFTIHTPIPKKKIGLGFSFTQDNSGPVSRSSFTGNLAYTIRFGRDGSRLSFGLKGGMNMYTIGLSSLKIIQGGDDKLGQDVKGEIKPVVGAGVYWYDDNFYVGISTPELLKRQIDSELTTESQSVFTENTHFYSMLGYVFEINSNFHIEPSTCLRYVKGAPFSYDITTLLIFNEKIFAGATFRNKNSLGILSKIKINKQLSLGMAYDYTLSDLSGYAANTYEIMLVYDFKYIKGVLYDTPSFF